MTEVFPAARATMMALLIAAFSLGRAFGDLIAPILYNHGIVANGVTAVAFNLLALLLLTRVKLPQESTSVTVTDASSPNHFSD
jgi:predicted MFS family arabinose efflux permease